MYQICSNRTEIEVMLLDGTLHRKVNRNAWSSVTDHIVITKSKSHNE